MTSRLLGKGVIDDVAEVAATCDSVARACNAAVSVLHGHTGAAVDVLLLSPGQLSVVAFSGAWQAPTAVPKAALAEPEIKSSSSCCAADTSTLPIARTTAPLSM